MDEKKANFLAALEREITKKYGEDAAKNIRSFWSDEKEEEYITQLKLEAEKETEYYRQKREQMGPDSLFTKRETLICEVCGEVSHGGVSVYHDTYGCCKRCYLTYVVGEEDRWEQKKKRLVDEKY